MFKKAKLYSLLLVIVASTVVGLFGVGGTVSADSTWEYKEDCRGTPCIETKSESPIYTYGVDSSYKDFYLMGNNVPFSLSELGIPDGSIMFHRQGEGSLTETANQNGWSNTHYIIYFETAEDFQSMSNAKIVIYQMGERDPETGQVINPNKIRLEKGPLSIDSSNPTAPIDEDTTEAQEDLQAPPETEVTTPLPSCDIKGVGWLICPVMNFLGGVIDASYWMLEHTFLRLEPILLPGGSGEGMALYDSWKTMRDVANVIFIIGFLIIVFSQVTSYGVSNYGVKRLLPKIIIAAILVNLSYFICALAVDLSNILGNGLRGFIESGAEIRETPLHIETDPGDPTAGEGDTITGWTGLIDAILSGTFMPASLQGLIGAGIAVSAVYIFLPIVIPMALSAALAIATVILVLSLRQALIVVLIIISPLAFVALLLPNTESWFSKWRSLFMSMLLVYPAISIIFGASQLASQILMATNDFPTQLIGAGVSVIPLAITPIVMKVSGGLLNRWAGMVNDPAKGPIDGLKRNVEGKTKRFDNRRKVTALRGGGGRFIGSRYRRKARSDAIDASLEARAKGATSSYISEESRGNANFQNELAGGMNVPIVGGQTIRGRTIPTAFSEASEADRRTVQASAVSAQSAERQKEIKERETLLLAQYPRDLTRIAEEMVRAIRSGDETAALATQNILLNAGNTGVNNWRGAMETVNTDGNITSPTVTAMKEEIVLSHPGMKDTANDVAEFAQNTDPARVVDPVSTYTTDARTWNVSDQQFFSQKTSSQLNATMYGTAIGTREATRLLRHEQAANLNPLVRENLNDIIRGAPPRHAPVTPTITP